MSNKYCPKCGSKHTKKMEHVTENSDINVAIADEYSSINASKENPFITRYGYSKYNKFTGRFFLKPENRVESSFWNQRMEKKKNYR